MALTVRTVYIDPSPDRCKYDPYAPRNDVRHPWPLSPWVKRAQAKQLPVKEYAR